MSDQTVSGQGPVTHVTFTFNRQVTEEEVRQMQSQHNAISAVLAAAEDHHHHHHTTEVLFQAYRLIR